MSTGFHVSLTEMWVRTKGRQAWQPSPLSLDICIDSPTHLIKWLELAIVTGLFIKPVSQTRRGKKWELILIRTEGNDLQASWSYWDINVHCRLALFWVCLCVCIPDAVAQTCCLVVCLNCSNLIGGQHLPASVTLHVQNIKPCFDHLGCSPTTHPPILTWHCVWNGLFILSICSSNDACEKQSVRQQRICVRSSVNNLGKQEIAMPLLAPQTHIQYTHHTQKIPNMLHSALSFAIHLIFHDGGLVEIAMPRVIFCMCGVVAVSIHSDACKNTHLG